MKRYYKRHWDETTGDDLTDSWGTSIYYFEIDEEWNVIRQLQIFDKGQVIKYDNDYPNDEYGGLSDQALDKDEFEEFLITKEEFLNTWDNLERQTK